MTDPQENEEGVRVTINGKPVTNPLAQVLAALGVVFFGLGMGAFGLIMSLVGMLVCVGVFVGLGFAAFALVALLPASFPTFAVIVMAFAIFVAGYVIVLVVGDLALRAVGLNGFRVTDGHADLNLSRSGTYTFSRKLRVSRNALRRRPIPPPAESADLSSSPRTPRLRVPPHGAGVPDCAASRRLCNFRSSPLWPYGPWRSAPRSAGALCRHTAIREFKNLLSA